MDKKVINNNNNSHHLANATALTVTVNFI